MTVSKGFVIIFRILMLVLEIWFSFISMLVFEMVEHSKMTVSYVLFALILSAIILGVVVLDLVLNTKLKKQDNDGYFNFSKNLNGVSFVVLFLPIVYVTIYGAFLELFVTIVPAVCIIASFADFARLLWIRED